MAQKLQRQIDQIGNVIDKVKRKKIKIEGGEDEVKALGELRNALTLTAKEYANLTTAQKKVLTELINKNEEYIKSLESGQQSLEETKKKTTNWLDAVNILTPVLGRHGVAVSLVVRNYLEYTRAAKDGKAASTEVGAALDILRNKYAAVAIAASALVGISVREYFRNTAEGADDYGRSLQGLKQVGTDLLGVISTGVVGLLTRNTKTLKSSFDTLKSIISGESFRKGGEIYDAFDAIEDKTSGLVLQNARLNAEIAKSREIISEEAQNLDDILNKKAALLKVREAEEKFSKNDIELAKARYDATLRQIIAEGTFQKVSKEALAAQVEAGNITAVTDEQRQRLITARTAVIEAETQSAAKGRAFNKLGKSINTESERLINEYLEVIKKFNQTVTDLELEDPLGLGKLITQEDKIKAQERILQSLQGVKDGLKTSSKLLGINDILTLDENQRQALETRFKLASGSILKAIFSATAIENQLDAALTEIGNANRLKLEVEIIPKKGTDGLPNIGKQIQEAVNVTNNPPDQQGASIFERLFSLSDKDKEAVKEGLNFVKDQLTAGLNSFYEAEIAKTDFLISEQERRIEETNKLAELGNAEQLQLEQERLNNLLEERQKAVEQQKALNAIEIVSTTALNAAKYATVLLDESIKTTPVVAIVQGLALLASIAAGISQISALSQGFEGGVDVLTPNSKSRRGKTDTIPAWLAPGERVVPAQLNKDLGNIKNQDLPMLVAAGKMLLGGYGQWNSDKTFDSGTFPKEALELLRDQNRAIKEIPFAIQDQLIDINFDYSGYTIQQRRQSRYAQKVQSLRR